VPDRWRLSIDPSACVGSGLCTGNAPSHFTLTEGTAQPRTDEIDADEDALTAAESCPGEAITVTEAVSGRTLAGPDAD